MSTYRGRSRDTREAPARRLTAPIGSRRKRRRQQTATGDPQLSIR
jgi:hypothetical protein